MRKGFSLVELMIAISIMAVTAAATMRFFASSQRATRAIEGRLNAMTESDRILLNIRRGYLAANGNIQLSVDGSGAAQSLTVGNVVYENACEPALAQHLNKKRAILYNRSTLFTDCPPDCAQGQRPVVRIRTSTNSTQFTFPPATSPQLFGAKVCARRLEFSRLGETNVGRFQIFVMTAYDRAQEASNDGDVSTRSVRDDFLWEAQGLFLSPGGSASLTRMK